MFRTFVAVLVSASMIAMPQLSLAQDEASGQGVPDTLDFQTADWTLDSRCCNVWKPRSCLSDDERSDE